MEAVLLDAAGTLICPSAPVAETYAAAARRYGVVIESAALARAFIEVFDDMPELAFHWTAADDLARLEREWWRRLVHRVIASTGNRIGDFDGFFESLYEHYAEGNAWRCFPEVAGVLRALRDRGCKLAVVSNSDSRLPGILEALGIRGFLDAIIYSSEAGYAKPDPGIFEQVLAALGADPHRAIHVGDRVEADLRGAASAGIAGLLLQRDPATDAAGPEVIRSLDELLVRIG